MTPDELILDLCAEGGDDILADPPEVIKAWRANHANCCQQYLDEAVGGDPAALIRIRTCMGLRLTT